MDLAATFERLGLQQTTQPHLHVLSLEYPVTSLIPAGSAVGLRMEPPRAALHREEPCLDKYFLREQGLDFFVRYPVSDQETKAATSSGAGLSAAINHLCAMGGRSTLQAVTVSDDNHGDGYYLFRLTTIWHGSEKRDIQEFQIGESGWKHLANSKAHRSWTRLLLNLFSRSSDRAFFHAERQLHGSQHAAIGALKWDAYEIRSINERLAINMREVQDLVNLLCLLPIRDLGGVSDRVITVRLPCDHDIFICVRDIKSKSKAECIDMTCPLCGGQVLPDKDIVHAQHSVERRRKQRIATDEILWKRIETERLLNNKDRICFTGSTLCLAFGHALRSMQVPVSVSPRELCPAWSAEASAVLEKLNQTHGNSNEPMATTVDDLSNHLNQTINIVLQDLVGLQSGDFDKCLLPGWSSFARRWIERTVKLLDMPDYVGQDVWEVFGEVPDEDICISMMEEEQAGNDMDLGALMGSCSLL